MKLTKFLTAAVATLALPAHAAITMVSNRFPKFDPLYLSLSQRDFVPKPEFAPVAVAVRASQNQRVMDCGQLFFRKLRAK
ncbi:MAG: hypothetical protein ACI9R3_006463, partial [Verrucomicrobiales bacterium]